MNSAITFWFWGMIISLVLTLLAYAARDINNRWGNQRYTKLFDAVCWEFFLVFCGCVMAYELWIFE